VVLGEPIHAQELLEILSPIRGTNFPNQYLKKNIMIVPLSSGIGAYQDAAWMVLYGTLENGRNAKLVELRLLTSTLKNMNLVIAGE